MQRSILRSLGILTSLILIVSTAFSFTVNRGGDMYEIRLNNKLLLRQFVHLPVDVKALNLGAANSADQLTVLYSHCGTTGKGRSLAVKDAKGKILQQWNFKDANGAGNNAMSISVKELLQIEKKNSGNPLSLYYSSKELPAGRMLTSLQFPKTTVASNDLPESLPLPNAGSVLRIACK